MKNDLQKKPCCSKFDRHILSFVDESTNLDKHLSMLGCFCSSLVELNYLTQETIQELGSTIRRYLDRRAVLEHFYFGRDTEQVLNTELLQGELSRLKKYHAN